MTNNIVYRFAEEKDLFSISRIYKENKGLPGLTYAQNVLAESKKDPQYVCIAEQQINETERTVIGFARNFLPGKNVKDAFCNLDLAPEVQEEVLLKMRMETKQIVEKKRKKIEGKLDKELSVKAWYILKEKTELNKQYKNQ